MADIHGSKYVHESHQKGSARDEIGADRKLAFSAVDRRQNHHERSHLDAFRGQVLISISFTIYPPDHFSSGVIELMRQFLSECFSA